MQWLKHLSVCSIIALLVPVLAGAQPGIRSLLTTADRLNKDGLYEQAAIEYQRVIFFATDPVYLFEANFGLGTTYSKMNDWHRAEQAYEAASSSAPNDSLRTEASLALASTYLIIDESNLAQLTFIPLLTSGQNDYCHQAFFLSIAAEIKNHNWIQASSLLHQLDSVTGMNDSLLQHLHGLLAQAEADKPLDPERAKWYSTIIPGTGQFYAGDIKNGCNALALNSLNFWIIVNNLVKADYVSAVLYTLVIAERYYFGNRYHAEQITITANVENSNSYATALLNDLVRLIDKFPCHN